MLPSDEVVVRSTVIPKMVLSGAISPARAISDFHKGTDETGATVYTISVGRKILLPDEESVHDYGCRVAAAQNAGLENRLGRPLVRGEETQHYRGSYSLPVGPIGQLGSEVFDINVDHVPKPNLDEHCDIEMRRTQTEFRKIFVSEARTSVIASLRLLCFDPIEHICSCDEDLRHQLAPIRLVNIDTAE